MFSSYGRFLPLERKQEAYEALLRMHGNFNNCYPFQKNQRGTGRFLRYCPMCAKEDREKYGETYWHRIHQIEGIQICRKHGCYLCESKISMDRQKKAGFWDAETLIPQSETIQICRDRRKIAFTEYISQVLMTPMQASHERTILHFFGRKDDTCHQNNTFHDIHLSNRQPAFHESEAAINHRQNEKPGY